MSANRHCDRQTQRGQSTVEHAGIGFIRQLYARLLRQFILLEATTTPTRVSTHRPRAKILARLIPASVPSHVEEKKASTSAGVSIPGVGPGTIDVNGSDGKSVKKNYEHGWLRIATTLQYSTRLSRVHRRRID